jgi:hypothetical protein
MVRRVSLACAFLCCGVAALALSNGGCSTKAESSSCSQERVDAFKELLVVDEGVLGDARSNNGMAGPWSFRHAVENIAPSGAPPGEFVRNWLLTWTSFKDINGFPVDQPNEGRAGGLNVRILCPWLKRTATNACDEQCKACAAQDLDLAQAPFRLIAITNRVDLREQVASEPNGEGRLVFALTDGAADNAASPPLAMTVAFEYALPASRSPKQWAELWHALGAFSSYDEPYRAALEGVTNAFTKRGSNPSGIGGSALGQVRTNESALDWIWQQREFSLTPDGALTNRPVRNTPAQALNGSTALSEYVLANADAIRSEKYELPVALRAGSSDSLLYSWQIPGIDEATRSAFAAGTCNGCHGFERANRDTAFHVSPFHKGTGKLSPFLYDPAGGPDELKTRAESTNRALCSP